jgi:aspartate racemase
MVKHIGIIAVSFEGAALCYRTICQEAMAVMGGFVHPEVTMHNYSLSRYMDCIGKDDWDGGSVSDGIVLQEVGCGRCGLCDLSR